MYSGLIWTFFLSFFGTGELPLRPSTISTSLHSTFFGNLLAVFFFINNNYS